MPRPLLRPVPSPARLLAVLLLALVALPPAGASARRGAAPHLAPLRCVPVHRKACRRVPTVRVHQQVQLRGTHLRRGMRVTFRWSRGALATKLRRTRVGWIARVPRGTRAGRVWVYVTDRHHRRSNRRRLRVAPTTRRPRPSPAPGASGLPAAFQGNGMWIWELPSSEGGDPAAIGARARAAGLSTVFVKSADGTRQWSQFTADLVAALHAQGLRVCGWQYVYGGHPVAEARVAAAAAAAGADCFVIDAESEYQGRYAAAQRYVQALRAAVGPDYPVGLTTFPYVDYHPSLPYSVFLGPGAAQVNLPQVYWKAIGGGVDAVSAHTYVHNRIYGAPMAPLGQAYDAPKPADLQRFRQLWAGYGATGLSWWSWQASSESTWATLAQPAPAPLAEPDPGWPALKRGSKGDQVIWLQEHLASEQPGLLVDGDFQTATDQALRAFQERHGLPATGVTDAATWQAVLALPLQAPDWTAAPAATASRARAARAPEIPVLGRGGG